MKEAIRLLISKRTSRAKNLARPRKYPRGRAVARLASQGHTLSIPDVALVVLVRLQRNQVELRELPEGVRRKLPPCKFSSKSGRRAASV